MKKFLITGGSGFIGTNFINLISKKNIKILNIDKISKISTLEKYKKILKKKNYTFKKYNLSDKNKTYKIINSFKPDAIINFAAESHVDRSISDPIYFISNNINSSTNIFFAYKEYYKKKKIKLYHISTDEVYGSKKKGSSVENDKYDPSSPYSASKASTDLIAKAFNRTYNTEIKILNLTNNFGPYQYPEKFIPTLIFHFFKNKMAPIYGNGSNIREWMYVEDCCNAILKCVLSKAKYEQVNIGSDLRLTNLQIANMLFQIMKKENLTGLDKNNFLKFVKDRPGHDFRYALNSNFFKKKVKFKISKNLRLGMSKTISWYIKNKSWLKSTNKSYNFKRLGLID